MRTTALCPPQQPNSPPPPPSHPLPPAPAVGTNQTFLYFTALFRLSGWSHPRSVIRFCARLAVDTKCPVSASRLLFLLLTRRIPPPHQRLTVCPVFPLFFILFRIFFDSRIPVTSFAATDRHLAQGLDLAQEPDPAGLEGQRRKLGLRLQPVSDRRGCGF